MFVHTPFLFQLIMLVFHSSPILPFPLESIHLISLSFFVGTAYECVQNMNLCVCGISMYMLLCIYVCVHAMYSM